MKKFTYILLCLFAFFYDTSVESALRGRIEGAQVYLRLETELAGQKELKEDFAGGGIFMSLVPADHCGLCVKPYLVGGINLDYTFTTFGCGIGYMIPLHQSIYVTPVCGLSHMTLEVGPLKELDMAIDDLARSLRGEKKPRSNKLIINEDTSFKNLNFNFGGELLCRLSDQFHLTGIYLYGYGITNKQYETLVKSYEVSLKDHSKGFFCGIVADYCFKNNLSLSIGGSYFYAHFNGNDLNVEGFAVKCGLAYLF
ncbi:MAG: hypothetical protein Tsb0021_17190 [Chlamydiales bacterium]